MYIHVNGKKGMTDSIKGHESDDIKEKWKRSTSRNYWMGNGGVAPFAPPVYA